MHLHYGVERQKTLLSKHFILFLMWHSCATLWCELRHQDKQTYKVVCSRFSHKCDKLWLAYIEIKKVLIWNDLSPKTSCSKKSDSSWYNQDIPFWNRCLARNSWWSPIPITHNSPLVIKAIWYGDKHAVKVMIWLVSRKYKLLDSYTLRWPQTNQSHPILRNKNEQSNPSWPRGQRRSWWCSQSVDDN